MLTGNEVPQSTGARAWNGRMSSSMPGLVTGHIAVESFANQNPCCVLRLLGTQIALGSSSRICWVRYATIGHFIFINPSQNLQHQAGSVRPNHYTHAAHPQGAIRISKQGKDYGDFRNYSRANIGPFIPFRAITVCRW